MFAGYPACYCGSGALSVRMAAIKFLEPKVACVRRYSALRYAQSIDAIDVTLTKTTFRTSGRGEVEVHLNSLLLVDWKHDGFGRVLGLAVASN
jgi:hypothetical protein